jgi:protein-tyrosine-phosphatase/tRNA A37 threonylcarbamoyladenosine synthetase subunit TsaC/SUA5/YrdC
MPEVLDWPRLADPQAVLMRAVQALSGGRVVVFPTQTCYVLAASATSADALRRLAAVRSATLTTALAVHGEPDALTWAPKLSHVGRRLTRRCWPGPVVLTIAGADLERVPEAARDLVSDAGGLRLWSPGHEALLEVLFQRDEPLVIAGIEGESKDIAQAVGENVEFILADGTSSGQKPTVVRLHDDSWSIAQPGVVSAETLVGLTNCVIVFVCTGNTCRSPLAEALCKKRLADRLGCTVDELPARGFSVLSAGLAAMMGGAAADEAIAVAETYGADLTRHRSRPLSVELAAQADHLIGMTHGHVMMMNEYYPQLGAEPRLLRADGKDIADPVGCSRDVYEECARQIWQSLDSLLADLPE